MKEFISHFTAAYLWEIPYLDSVFDSKDVKDYHEDRLQYNTVKEERFKHHKKDRVTHIKKKNLPPNAVKKLNRLYVSSPELVFLELASYLDIHRLILLGLEMCSCPPGKPTLAITTTKKIENFLSKTVGTHGHQKAVQALKYVKNGSGSIMESFAYMILGLPNSLGGFGLSDVCFNYEIKLNKEESRELNQNRCFVDLYYDTVKLVLEYDSLEHHSKSGEQSEDMIRADVLKSKGYDVVRFNATQLYNKDSCYKFAKRVSQKLKKRIRIRTKDFYSANRKLRHLLPRK